MASSGSWPNSDVLSQCFTVVRWLHEQGTSWSGTNLELASKLSSYSDTARWFSNDDQLVSFLETNVIMLRELGVEASITRFTGRPSVVDLKSSAPDASIEPRVSSEPTIQSPVFEPHIDEPAPQHEVQQLVVADEHATAADASNLNKPADRLYSMLGVPEIEIMLDGFNPEVKAEPAPVAPVRARSKTMPLVIAAGLVAALAVFVFVRSQSAKSTTPPPPAVSAAVPAAPAAAPIDTTPAIDPAESDEFNKLLHQATSTKDSTAQYELALRYAEGRGVKRDNAAAYAWLSLARTNGSLAADSAIQTLTPSLSSDELQRASIAIANAFAAGTVVQKSYVSAYRWLSQAERGGSAEAVDLKKQLEVRMPVWQIQQAGGQPPSRTADKK